MSRLPILILLLLPALLGAQTNPVSIAPATTRIGIAKAHLGITQPVLEGNVLVAQAEIRVPLVGYLSNGELEMPLPEFASQPVQTQGTYRDQDAEEFPFRCTLIPSNDTQGELIIEIVTPSRQLTFKTTYQLPQA